MATCLWVKRFLFPPLCFGNVIRIRLKGGILTSFGAVVFLHQVVDVDLKYDKATQRMRGLQCSNVTQPLVQ